MEMNWIDLEVGDVIRATPRVRDRHPKALWAAADLTIKKIQVVFCENAAYIYLYVHDYWGASLLHFTLNERGENLLDEPYGQFFEVVKLGER